MGFLTLVDGLPNFRKGVISFWFRVPSSSLVAASEQSDSAPMKGIVPLIAFGDPNVSGYNVSSGFTPAGSYTSEAWYFVNQTGHPHDQQYWLKPGTGPFTFNVNDLFYNPGTAVAKPPCFIGIDTQQGEVANVLRFRIQLSDLGTGAGMGYNYSNSVSGDLKTYAGENNFPDTNLRGGGAPPAFFTDGLGDSTFYIPDHNPWVSSSIATDRSDVQFGATTEYFEVALKTAVVPNRWHHVLISFDLTGSVSASGRLQDILNRFGQVIVPGGPDKGTITSSCKVWIAFDTVNKIGSALDYGVDFDLVENTLGPNDFITQNSVDTASASSPQDYAPGQRAQGGYISNSSTSGQSLPSYSFFPSLILSADHALGIPAAAENAGRIQVVEMAELQFFTGVTCDTANPVVISAFVTEQGKPAPPTNAQLLLEQPPDIMLQGRSENWIAGTNTGVVGANLEPTGTITAYEQGPTLG